MKHLCKSHSYPNPLHLIKDFNTFKQHYINNSVSPLMLNVYKHVFFYIYTNMKSDKRKFVNKKFKFELFKKCYDEVVKSEYWNRKLSGDLSNVIEDGLGDGVGDGLGDSLGDSLEDRFVCNLYSVYDVL